MKEAAMQKEEEKAWKKTYMKTHKRDLGKVQRKTQA